MRIIMVAFAFFVILSSGISYAGISQAFLFKGAQENNLHLMTRGLALGASLTARTGVWRWAALHVAASKNNVLGIELLLRAGADLNIKDAAGWTPLHVAAHYGCKETVAYLLSQGADIYGTNATGRTAWSVANHQGFPEIKELIEYYGKVYDNNYYAPLLWGNN